VVPVAAQIACRGNEPNDAEGEGSNVEERNGDVGDVTGVWKDEGLLPWANSLSM